MNKVILFSGILALSLILALSAGSAAAHPHPGMVFINGHTHESQTVTIPLNSNMLLEKSSILFHAPHDNKLPWAFVEGKIAHPVQGYPVVIQIFRAGDPVHFAQTDVDVNGNYEYKFRVLNYDDNTTTKLFDGDYIVKIFKVVYASQQNII